MSSVLIYQQLPRGVRNNNPLNIRKGQRWNGSVPGLDKTYETFISPLYGFRAAARIIKGAYRQRGIHTLQQVITEWAPASDHNPTQQYIEFVADKVQISPADDVDDAHLPAVLNAMSAFEQGGDYYGVLMAKAGVNLA
ncbi:MAG: hypothetical protein CENE_03287 [Candidatus Celerinatantimonas neptuna]|nr:MAG: hypothetical protein CENE_03287 [Candidatus Celerinatantimonas neptuna]